MEKSDAYRKSSGSSKKWDGGGPGGGSGPYGGSPPGPPRGGLDNVRGLRDVRSADHSKFLFLINCHALMMDYKLLGFYCNFSLL